MIDCRYASSRLAIIVSIRAFAAGGKCFATYSWPSASPIDAVDELHAALPALPLLPAGR